MILNRPRLLDQRRLEFSGLFRKAGRTMWPNLIVVSTPILHLFAGIRKGQEPVLVQAFGSEAAVERLDEGVVGRFTRAREVQGHAFGVGPEVEIA